MHPPPSTARANFTLMIECTPESSGYYSLYSVVESVSRGNCEIASIGKLVRLLSQLRPRIRSQYFTTPIVCFLHWKNKCLCVLDTMMEAGVQTATAGTVMNMPSGNPLSPWTNELKRHRTLHVGFSLKLTC